MCVALKPDWTKVKLEAQKVRKNDFQSHLAGPCALWVLDSYRVLLRPAGPQRTVLLRV